jgi:hypothetical protein
MQERANDDAAETTILPLNRGLVGTERKEWILSGSIVGVAGFVVVLVVH